MWQFVVKHAEASASACEYSKALHCYFPESLTKLNCWLFAAVITVVIAKTKSSPARQDDGGVSFVMVAGLRSLQFPPSQHDAKIQHHLIMSSGSSYCSK